MIIIIIASTVVHYGGHQATDVSISAAALFPIGWLLDPIMYISLKSVREKMRGVSHQISHEILLKTIQA